MQDDQLTFVLTAFGAVVLAGHLVYLRRNGELRRPLASLMPRRTSLGPEHVLIVFVVYVLMVASGPTLLGPPPGGPTTRATASIPTSDLGPHHPHQARRAAQLALVDIIARIVGGVMILWFARELCRGGLAGFGLRARGLGRQLGIGVLGYAGAAPLVYGTAELVLHLVMWLRPETTFPQHDVLVALSEPSLAQKWKLCLIANALIAAPVGEELFFRGLIQNVLQRTLGSRYAAVLLAGVAFGLAHSTQPQFVLPLAIFGVILGYLYERTGSLIVPLAAHVVFNGVTLGNMMMRYGA